MGMSVNVHEFVQVQDQLAQFGDGAIVVVIPPLDEAESDVDLAVGRLTTERVFVEAFDL
jgi:hypothetical protein